MLPQPVIALLLLFPITDESEAASKAGRPQPVHACAEMGSPLSIAPSYNAGLMNSPCRTLIMQKMRFPALS